MSLKFFMIDTRASEDVIDLYFMRSDLKDISMSDAEMMEQAVRDTECSGSIHDQTNDPEIPRGKRVL